MKRLALFAALAVAALAFAVPATLAAGPSGSQQCTNVDQVVLVYSGTHTWTLNIQYAEPGTTFSGTASDDALPASGTVTGTFSGSTMSFDVTYVYGGVTYVWHVGGLPISGGTATSSSQNGVTFPPGSTTMTPGVEACTAIDPALPPPQPPAREAYCSVAGNTNPFSGSPIAAGTFLDLLAGQAKTDSHYTGAVPAFWVEGIGLTCSLTPAQAALAAASTQRVGAAGDPEIPIPGISDYAIYTYIPAK